MASQRKDRKAKTSKRQKAKSVPKVPDPRRCCACKLTGCVSQPRNIVCGGVKRYACNGCGCSYLEFKGKRRAGKSEPSPEEWAAWWAARIKYDAFSNEDEEAIKIEAAETLLSLRNTSDTPPSSLPSPIPSTSSPTSTLLASAPSSESPNSATFEPPDLSAYEQTSFSSYRLVPPATYKANRPDGLTVQVEGALFVDCGPAPELSSTASSCGYDELPTPWPWVSFFPHEILFASGRNEGNTAYLDQGKPSAASLL